MRKSILVVLLLLVSTVFSFQSILALDEGSTYSPDTIRFQQSELHLLGPDGQTWNQIPIFDFINKTTYITSAARHPTDATRAVIGTSFEGIYETTDAGKSWKFISESRVFTSLFQGAGFYDEVSSIAYTGTGNDIAFQIAHGGGTWIFNRQTNRVSRGDHNFLPKAPVPQGFFTTPALPVASTNNSPEARLARRSLAADKRGVFINPGLAGSTNFIPRLDMVIQNGMNSIVIDFKDDEGTLTYNSSLEIAKQIGSIRQRFNAQEIIAKAHAKGIYVIARIVVFKDKKLYAFERNAYALWDKTTNKPWGQFRQETPEATTQNPNPQPRMVQIDHWVDPYADFVHQYNIAIAKELQTLGVDEIQFDYIRFPSDGNTRAIQARFHRDTAGRIINTETGLDRVHALSNFLKKAREAITLPISTDVFGFNGWTRMSYLGQDIQAIANYVDVISPMAYPSHYATSFLPQFTYFDRASHLYNQGTKRARAIVEDKVLIRPYVQAFLIGSERNYEEPRYFDYLNRQVRGSKLGGASGFTLWNQLGNYYMIDQRNFKTMLGE